MDYQFQKKWLFSSVLVLLVFALRSQTIGLSFGHFFNGQSAYQPLAPVEVPNLKFSWIDWAALAAGNDFAREENTWLLVQASSRFDIGFALVTNYRIINYFKLSYQQFNFNGGYLTYGYDARDSSLVSPGITSDLFVKHTFHYGVVSLGKQWLITPSRKSNFAIRPTLALTFGALLDQNAILSDVSDFSFSVSNVSSWEDEANAFYIGAEGIVNFTYTFDNGFGIMAGGFVSAISHAAQKKIDGYQNFLDQMEYFGGSVYKERQIHFLYGAHLGITYALSKKRGQRRNNKGVILQR
jgi:hypothetical protein